MIEYNVEDLMERREMQSIYGCLIKRKIVKATLEKGNINPYGLEILFSK